MEGMEDGEWWVGEEKEGRMGRGVTQRTYNRRCVRRSGPYTLYSMSRFKNT